MRVVRRICAGRRRQPVIVDGECLNGGKELVIEINGRLVIISVDAIKGRIDTFGEVIQRNGIAAGINIVVQYIVRHVKKVAEEWIDSPDLLQLMHILKVFLTNFLQGVWEKTSTGFWLWLQTKWSAAAALKRVIESALVRKVILSIAEA